MSEIYLPTRTLAPSTKYVHAIRRRGRDWVPVIAELLDNSIDAKATTVTCRFGGPKKSGAGGWLEIEDNGHGVRNIDALLQLGTHDAISTGGSVGMYGVGGTEAIIWISDRVLISTVLESSPDELITQDVDWISLERDGTWAFEAAYVSDADGREPGTLIRCENVQHNRPDIDVLAKKLGRLFQFFLRAGGRLRLEVDGIECLIAAPLEPPFEGEPVEARVQLDSTRWLEIRGGLVRKGTTNTSEGVTYGYKHRTLDACSAKGLVNKLAYNRISATVLLGGNWDGLLETNKTGLGKCEDEIVEQVEQVLCELSHMAAEEGVEIKFRAAQEVINQKCREFNERQRETRDRRGDRGTHGATGKGPKRRPKKTQAARDPSCRGMQITLTALGVDKPLVSSASGSLIRINTDHHAAIAYLEAEQVASLYQIGVDAYCLSTAINDRSGPLFEQLDAGVLEKYFEHHSRVMVDLDIRDLISKSKTALKAVA